MNSQTIQKNLRQIAHLSVSKIKDFKKYGLIEQMPVDEGNESRHILLVEFNGNISPFKWTVNDDVCECCERVHEGRNYISNCSSFNKWNEYAKETANELAKEYGVEVKVELQGRDSIITLEVQVVQKPASRF